MTSVPATRWPGNQAGTRPGITALNIPKYITAKASEWNARSAREKGAAVSCWTAGAGLTAGLFFRSRMRKMTRVTPKAPQNAQCTEKTVASGVAMSVGPDGDATDDANPVDAAAVVAHELDRLALVGPVRDDEAIGPVEHHRGVPGRTAAVLAILHEQLFPLGADDVRIARTRVGAQVRRRIGLPGERLHGRKRFHEAPMRDRLVARVAGAEVR